MLYYKTAEEINHIKESCQLVNDVLAELVQQAKAGTSVAHLRSLAMKMISEKGATDGVVDIQEFKGINFEGESKSQKNANSNELQLQDFMIIDLSLTLNGFYGMATYSFAFETSEDKLRILLLETEQKIRNVIKSIRIGERSGEIGRELKRGLFKGITINSKALLGHGIGKQLIEFPEIKWKAMPKSGIQLKPGIVIVLKPEINFCNRWMKPKESGWALKSKSESIGAKFGYVISITADGAEVLTGFEKVKEQITI